MWLRSRVGSDEERLKTVGSSIFYAHISFGYFKDVLCLHGLMCNFFFFFFLTAASFPHHKHIVQKMDEAFLAVNNELNTDITVSWVSERCYQCLYQNLGVVSGAPSPGQPSSADFVVSTQHTITLQLNSTEVCQHVCKLFLTPRFPFHFGEHGNYSLWVKNLNNSSLSNCSVVTDADPVNSYILRSIFFQITGTMETERLINSVMLPNKVTFCRFPFSISLVIMVFVNYGGGRYWFFKHESWNGLTVADLVFPWFVFIMGTSIALSINSLLRSGTSRSSVLKKVVWRSLQLFIIGVFIVNPNYCQGPISWDNLRIPGVLQRLAWSYLVVACLDLLVARAHLDIISMEAWWSCGLDILLYWPAWLCVLLMEVIWLCLTFLLPVPGCPTGYLGPGGIGDMGQFINCTGGAAGFIDRWLLGEKHIYQNPTSRVIYATHMPFDPEGVLGSINSILMAFLGLQAGKIILHYRDVHTSIMSRFLIWGLFLGVISAVLTRCSTDQGFIPVNKNMWSLSYVTTLACFAYVLLVLVYYTVDVKKWWSGAPFYYPGMNSILVYVGHEVFEDYFPFRWRMVNSQSHAEHLTQNLVATSCWVFISYVLYRKKIFWKI
uniref:Heparan-alpha-glucosaminide N-acetyltransferase-like n=1 Tax=Sphaeramia orbicularis TaxID=375764 RepID=A0A673AL03_9TELE